MRAHTTGHADMLEINPIIQTLKDIEDRTEVLRGYL